MKLVLDTNVLIAALIARGVCADLLEHCVLNHEIVTSNFILNELRRHLAGKFKYTDHEADEVIQLFMSQMQVVSPQLINPPACRDPDDDQVLGTALTGQAECIITGDKDLLILQQHEGVRIINPGDFSDFESNA